MRRGIILAALLVLVIGSKPVGAQVGTTVVILAPANADVLQGNVEIRGTVDGVSFLWAELAFAYAEDPTAWFTIMEIAQPIIDAELATWDTTAISDGDYRLRLRLSSLDGTVEDAYVDVQVRNYTAPIILTPLATSTSRPSLQIETPIVLRASPTSVRPQPLTPTKLPANPASLTSSAIFGGFSRGALAVLAVCLIVIMLLVRRRP